MRNSPQGLDFFRLSTSNSRLDNFFRLKIPLQTACLTLFAPFQPDNHVGAQKTERASDLDTMECAC